MKTLQFEHALLPEGWARSVRIEVDEGGWIREIRPHAEPFADGEIPGVAIPGMPNAHSHAFQRAMAGFAEVRGSEDDSFWTWRELMYRFLSTLTPEDTWAIAAQAYVEMLEAGFTAVAEFHYLHHDPQGIAYEDPGAMCHAVADAADRVGIGMTLLPVFYAQGGFGARAAAPEQRRFVNDVDTYAALVERAREICRGLSDGTVGVAPHSLRAVTPESLRAVLSLSEDGPVHLHVAEQRLEVDECVAWSGVGPVQWLLDHHDLDADWCLVHATHMSNIERARLAASGAAVAICPITEANLGDGIFDGVAYLGDGGHVAIGSDCNILISVAEELRLLEYSQRLRDGGRSRLAGEFRSTGRSLVQHALAGGARACGRRIGRLAAGYRADVVVLDAGHPALACRNGDAWLDGWVFAAENSLVSEVWVGGHHVVHDGAHVNRDQVRDDYRRALSRQLS